MLGELAKKAALAAGSAFIAGLTTYLQTDKAWTEIASETLRIVVERTQPNDCEADLKRLNDFIKDQIDLELKREKA